MAARKKRTRRANLFPKVKAGPGRPGWKPTPEDLKKIEALAQRAVPKKTVAATFGFAPQHWCDIERRFPEITECYVKGLADSHNRAFDKLKDHIYVKDSERMLSYYLDKVYGLDPKQGVNVNIDNSTTTNNTTNNVQINFDKLSNEELKSLANQAMQSLDLENENIGAD